MSIEYGIPDAIQHLEVMSEEGGTDTYFIEGNSPEVHDYTRKILSAVYAVCGGSTSKVVQWGATEHNRSYGDMRRVSLAIVVAVPKQGKNARLLSKSARQATGDKPETEGVPGQQETAYPEPTTEGGLTESPSPDNLVPGSTEVNEAPSKRRKVG